MFFLYVLWVPFVDIIFTYIGFFVMHKQLCYQTQPLLHDMTHLRIGPRMIADLKDLG